MVDVTRALTIRGWMTEPELTWLAEQAQSHQAIVEVGSYLGRSTRALCDHTSGKVWAVDDWYGPRDVELDANQRRNIFGHFQKHMEGCEGKLEIVIADHGSPQFDVSPDMVFIDGDHSYASVHRDITFWREKLLPGGLLCGHDINIDGVRAACLELVPDGGVVPDTTIWYVTKSL